LFFCFLGALDLISTSRDILRVDLQGVTSFRHLSSQLQEIQSIIGKMLLGDFQAYIASEIHRDIKHVKVSIGRRCSLFQIFLRVRWLYDRKACLEKELIWLGLKLPTKREFCYPIPLFV
jgi:hypothetical protein